MAFDVARYAEDQAHAFAWQVEPRTPSAIATGSIDAFNQDMPYNRFVKLQIAADLMDDNSPEMVPHKAALGFFGLGAQYYKNSDAAKAAADELDDRVDTLTRGFLGLTVSCARCHDHKFDPVPTQDYYSIAGIFWSSKFKPTFPLTSHERGHGVHTRNGSEEIAGGRQESEGHSSRRERPHHPDERSPICRLTSLPPGSSKRKRMAKPDYSALTEQAEARQARLPARSIALTKFLNQKSQNVPGLDNWLRLKNLPKPGDKAGAGLRSRQGRLRGVPTITSRRRSASPPTSRRVTCSRCFTATRASFR